MFTYGKQPRSSIDSWCRGMKPNERNSHGEYLDALQRKKSELNVLAKEILGEVSKGLDRVSSGGHRRKGLVVVRNNERHESLDPRYDGPF